VVTRRSFDDIKRDFGRDRLLQLAESEGLARQGTRMQCPARCSEDKRRASVGLKDGIGVYHCKGCGSGGTVIDLLKATRGLVDDGEAARAADEWLGVAPVLPPKKEFPKKDGSALWAKLADTDTAGIEYIRGRGFEAAAHLFRFSMGATGDSWIDGKARMGYRVAKALRDAAGEVKNFQVRATVPREPSKLSLPGVPMLGLAFGDTAGARTAPVVYMAEGIFDTTAAELLGCAIGAPGVDQIRYLPDFVGVARGREFVLLVQNDEDYTKAKLTSRTAFERIATALKKERAIVRVVSCPDQYKDPAEWLQDVGVEQFRAAFESIRSVPQIPPAAAGAENAPVDGNAALKVFPFDRARAAEKPAGDPADWRKSLSFNSHGDAHPNVSNVVLALTRAPEWDGVLAFDEFEHAPKMMQPPPWSEDYAGAPESDSTRPAAARTYPCEWVNEDTLRLQIWLQRAAKMPGVGNGTAWDGMRIVAQQRRFHPIRDYFRRVQWDGVPRIDTWLTTYLGAEDSQYSRFVGPWWLLQGVGRIEEPGTKSDYTLIFEGLQGLGKSTGAEALSFPWFIDSEIDFNSKDGQQLLKGRWFVELGELSSFGKAKAAKVKQFLTVKVDVYRPPYGRSPEAIPRQCVFIGTVNNSEYLEDDTGGRRFWPVACKFVDVEGLKRDRDQIWAEAFARYQVDPKRWPTREEQEQFFTPVQEERMVVSPWEGLIAAWLMNPLGAYVEGNGDGQGRRETLNVSDGVTAAEILEYALHIPAERMHGKSAQTVGSIMQSRLRWKRRNAPTARSAKRIWAYHPPHTWGRDPADPASNSTHQEGGS
jgi:hypothetical protein